MSTVTVVGEILVDVTSRLTPGTGGWSRRGRTAVTVGGVGYNVAADLTLLDVEPRLVTVTGDGFWDRLAVETAEAAGVAVYRQRLSGAPSPLRYEALADGRPVFEVTPEPTPDLRLDDELLGAGLAGADAAVVTTSLPAPELGRVAAAAAAGGQPCFAVVASPGTVGQLAGLEEALAGVFMNAEERRALDGLPAPPALRDTPRYVTDRAGLTLETSEASRHYPAAAVAGELPAAYPAGAGDLVAAFVIARWLAGDRDPGHALAALAEPLRRLLATPAANLGPQPA